jgi:hypothetical protein
LVSRGSRRIIFFVMWMCSLSVVNMSVILWNQPKYGVHETNLSMEVSKPERKKVNQIYIWNKLLINRKCNNVPPKKLIMWKIKISEFIQESPLWKGKFLGVQLILLCIGTLYTNLFFKKNLTNKFKFISLFKITVDINNENSIDTKVTTITFYFYNTVFILHFIYLLLFF